MRQRGDCCAKIYFKKGARVNKGVCEATIKTCPEDEGRGVVRGGGSAAGGCGLCLGGGGGGTGSDWMGICGAGSAPWSYWLLGTAGKGCCGV